jgi:hypothetical protein
MHFFLASVSVPCVVLSFPDGSDDYISMIFFGMKYFCFDDGQATLV